MTKETSIKKIVAIGPESTGKSFLCEQLARYHNTLWCPEYARTYLTENGKDYSYNDLLLIASGQLALEDAMTEELQNKDIGNIQHPPSNIQPLFIDTDMYVMKVWCEYVFGKCHQFILDCIAERKYDLYLLCNIDLPWTPDELREYPEEAPRKELYNIYKNILINQQTPWIEISGGYSERLQKAIIGVEKYIFSDV